jgi:hypothetical protein
VTDLNDIDDIRNGVFAATQIHTVFDPRHVAILKVRVQLMFLFVSLAGDI